MPQPDALARPVARADLESLRSAIDSIDDALLDLMEQRLAASSAIAARKSDDWPSLLNLRPEREADILARLAGRARRMPASAIAGIWHELMALNLQAQKTMEIVVHAATQPIAVTAAVRRRFGSVAPILAADDPIEALDRARTRDAVAVIELAPLSNWWVALADDSRLVIFEGLRDAGGAIVALAVGRVAGAGPPRERRFAILGEGSLRQRIAQGEAIRPIAICGHLRLCLRESAGRALRESGERAR
jgi:chorismate mutase